MRRLFTSDDYPGDMLNWILVTLIAIVYIWLSVVLLRTLGLFGVVLLILIFSLKTEIGL